MTPRRLRDVLRLLLDAVTPRRLRDVLRLLLDDRGASSSTPGDALRLSRGALYGGLLEPNISFNIKISLN